MGVVAKGAQGSNATRWSWNSVRLIGRTWDEFASANDDEAEDWVKFFNDDDVYAMIGTVHTVLAQEVDPKHTKYAIPALSRALDSYGDEMARNKAFNLSLPATNHLLRGCSAVRKGHRVGGPVVPAYAGLFRTRQLTRCGTASSPRTAG